MRGLHVPRAGPATDLPAIQYLVSLLVALAWLVIPAVASAANGFTEQVASARWFVPVVCPDGSRRPTAA